MLLILFSSTPVSLSPFSSKSLCSVFYSMTLTKFSVENLIISLEKNLDIQGYVCYHKSEPKLLFYINP